MSVYIQDGMVLLNGGSVATDAGCCCEVCCSGGFIPIPLVNLNYEGSVSGTAISGGCITVYTLSGSSGPADLPLGNVCTFGIYQVGVTNVNWNFDTTPLGSVSPDCFAQFSIQLDCGLTTPNAWTIFISVSSSFSTGNCSHLCGTDILWGGGSIIQGAGSDPRGIYAIDIPDLSLVGITWHFAINIT